jgi:hypothetical protein
MGAQGHVHRRLRQRFQPEPGMFMGARDCRQHFHAMGALAKMMSQPLGLIMQLCPGAVKRTLGTIAGVIAR